MVCDTLLGYYMAVVENTYIFSTFFTGSEQGAANDKCVRGRVNAVDDH